MNPRRQPLGPDTAPMAAAAPMQFAGVQMPAPPPPGAMDQEVVGGLTKMALALQSKLGQASGMDVNKVLDSPLNRPRQPFPNAQQAAQLSNIA